MQALILVCIITTGTSIWVLCDSTAIGGRDYSGGINNTSPFGWFLFCCLLWIIGFPLYLSRRPALKERAANKVLTNEYGRKISLALKERAANKVLTNEYGRKISYDAAKKHPYLPSRRIDLNATSDCPTLNGTGQTSTLTPAATPPLESAAAPSLSVADELAKLAKLKADEVLTEAEFAAQKAKLLS
jgi:hypothetical protein